LPPQAPKRATTTAPPDYGHSDFSEEFGVPPKSLHSGGYSVCCEKDTPDMRDLDHFEYLLQYHALFDSL
jgi:hypothetical protein